MKILKFKKMSEFVDLVDMEFWDIVDLKIHDLERGHAIVKFGKIRTGGHQNYKAIFFTKINGLYLIEVGTRWPNKVGDFDSEVSEYILTSNKKYYRSVGV